MKIEQYNKGIEFMSNADMLIHDAQYTPEDYKTKRGWGHSCYEETITSAINAGVKCLYLFSHDPNYNDVKLDKIAAEAKEVVASKDTELACYLAREAMQVSFDTDRMSPGPTS